MELDAATWSALGYDETDRVSVARYLGDLECRTSRAFSTAVERQKPLSPKLAKALIDAGACNKQTLSEAAEHQQPLTLDLAKLLVDAGAFDKHVLSVAAYHQQPLTLELAKLLIDAGCDPSAQNGTGWDSLVRLAWGGHPADPQVTDLFLSAGCRRNLDGCKGISDGTSLRFDQILQEYAMWKTEPLNLECIPTDCDLILDWGK